jgi:hypothetical protein
VSVSPFSGVPQGRVATLAPRPFGTPLKVLLALTAVAGCHPDPPREHLSTVTPSDAPAELRELVRRSSLIHTVAGSGTLNLTGPDGQSVVLDLAVALAPPDRARVQAFKFGQTVFDLTVLPTGAWLEASDHGGGRAAVAGATAARVTRGLSLLGGGFFNDPATTGHDDGDQLLLTRPRPGEPTIVCHVERATLVPRRFELVDDAGRVRFTLSLESYQPAAGGALWPRRVVADGDGGRAVVTLDDADVNGGLPPAAFDVPPRAGRLP